MSEGRLDKAVAAIDAANQDDPNQIRVRGRLRPKELAHAELFATTRGSFADSLEGESGVVYYRID